MKIKELKNILRYYLVNGLPGEYQSLSFKDGGGGGGGRGYLKGLE